MFTASRLDNVLVAGYKQLCRNVDWDKQVVLTPWGDKYQFEEKVPSVKYLLEKSRFAEKIKSLDLSLQEEAMLRAILILSSGNTQLANLTCINANSLFALMLPTHVSNVRLKSCKECLKNFVLLQLYEPENDGTMTL